MFHGDHAVTFTAHVGIFRALCFRPYRCFVRRGKWQKKARLQNGKTVGNQNDGMYFLESGKKNMTFCLTFASTGLTERHILLGKRMYWILY